MNSTSQNDPSSDNRSKQRALVLQQFNNEKILVSITAYIVCRLIKSLFTQAHFISRMEHLPGSELLAE